MKTRAPALLALEDGSVFSGERFGATGTATGEVCFNTAMTGYQEVLTDPSYHGQIVAMTAPHIGNTGVNGADAQSPRIWAAGLVVRALATTYSSWRSSGSLDSMLRRDGIPGITAIDTRRLTRRIRSSGVMRAAVSSEITDPDDLVDVARAAPGLAGRDLAREVTTKTSYSWTAANLARHGPAVLDHVDAPRRKRHRIVALDFGIKRAILDQLVAGGCDVTVVPATASPRMVLAGGFDGVVLSNGPGDPEPVDYGVSTVRALVGRVPIFGICLGHQILGLAVGGRTFKLPFGHRGGNHPVRRRGADRVEITTQNHGFAVDEASLALTPAHVTHINLNDGTVEGLAMSRAAFGVQYHPEAGPGPHDSRYLFREFVSLIERFEPVEVDLEQTA
jgi:carbamoyl-phosphate synthase small subunit